jgi:hypothetical protein
MNGDIEAISLFLPKEGAAWLAEGNLTSPHLAGKYGNAAVVKMLSEYADTRVAKQNYWRFIKIHDYEASARLQDTNAKTTGAFETKLFTPRELAVIFGHRDAAMAFPTSVMRSSAVLSPAPA